MKEFPSGTAGIGISGDVNAVVDSANTENSQATSTHGQMMDEISYWKEGGGGDGDGSGGSGWGL